MNNETAGLVNPTVMPHKLAFEYPEDAAFFRDLLSDVGGLEAWGTLFDFRDPDTKRREFGRIRNQVYEALVTMEGATCQLNCHDECSGTPDEVDHLIPLKTNVLSKQLRKMSGSKGKKVSSLSYGSNKAPNLVLACSRCNAFKKHRMPSQEIISRILGQRRITCY
jgi:hypothetical protein